jgi:hypothetical protein
MADVSARVLDKLRELRTWNLVAASVWQWLVTAIGVSVRAALAA